MNDEPSNKGPPFETNPSRDARHPPLLSLATQRQVISEVYNRRRLLAPIFYEDDDERGTAPASLT